MSRKFTHCSRTTSIQLTPKAEIGPWTNYLNMGEADGSPDFFLAFPPRTQRAILDLHKRMDADVSCSLEGAPGYWEEDLYRNLNDPKASWRNSLSTNGRWETRRIFTEELGLRWMPRRWGALPGDLQHQISDKGVISNSHACLSPTDAKNVTRWVRALAAYAKIGKDWMWQ